LILAVLIGALGCARTPVNYDRRVLVMDFQNLITADQTSNLGAAMADLLTANLANHDKIVVVERQANPALQSPSWQEAGRKADVDYVIVGSISRLQENYIIAIRLLSMSTLEVVPGSSVERSCNREEDLYPVVAAMGNVMAHHLQILSQRLEARAARSGGS
jgi:TolB-like protein